MKTLILSSMCILLLSSTVLSQQTVKPVPVEPGVSLELANFRHSILHDVRYKLSFDIPAGQDDDIPASETIGFNWTANPQVLQIDFKETKEHLKSLTVNGKSVVINYHDEHIIIDPSALSAGHNEINIDFIAGNGPLNRNADYLYGLFVPDKARTLYPCFDQPDLKAKFLLTLKIPRDWKVLANAVKKDSVINDKSLTYHFAQTDVLPTYLFSFAAGKFKTTTQSIGRLNAEFLYRETDTTKIKLSVDSIFTAHKNAVKFLEQYTGIKYPFQKAGFVAISDFQYGGMEHPGEVEYKSSMLFLDKNATKDELIIRASNISHETSHMWFGNMVTMKWFNDVWMKEVFANFMADKVTQQIMGTPTYNLRFLQEHYVYAYAVDRTLGANPIRQQLTNLQDAGSLYGDIIYEKAPIVMRQLERMIGKENFRRGVDEYLKRYAYQNADWNDLISILKKHTAKNLDLWNQVWINLPGRPIIDYVETDKAGVIQKFVINQHAESGTSRNWPQTFQITFVYAGHRNSFPVTLSGRSFELTAAKGQKKPDYIIFNSDGVGYGVFPIEKNTDKLLTSISDPLQRSSIFINAYENMLSGRTFTPKDLLSIYLKQVNLEKDEMTLRMLCSYIKTIYWEFTSPEVRKTLTEQVEDTFWQAMENQKAPNNKMILFKAFQDAYTSSAAENKIYKIWKNKLPPEGLDLQKDDYISLALTIGLKTDQGPVVIKEQLDRISDPDRKLRLEYLMNSVSPDEKVRDAFFDSLAYPEKRKKDAWVVTALTYLNHPLRQPGSIKYIPKSLEWLEEFQRTGGVFFPLNTMTAVLNFNQSKEAYLYVTDFLKKHPDYNPKLKNKILQAADNLYRARNGLVP